MSPSSSCVEHNVRVGLALALGTPLEQLAPVIGALDAVLLLSRVTGEGTKGANFDPKVLSASTQGARDD